MIPPRQQIITCANRIPSTVVRERFINLHRRANELAAEASKLRLLAWQDYRRATGLAKGQRFEESSPYA
jgi:hypothetical protein